MDLALRTEHSNHLGYIIDRGNKYTTCIRSNRIARDLDLGQFLAFHQINSNCFGLPLQFWFNLNNIDNDTFFEITNEMIQAIGFSERASLYCFIRKHFVEHVDYKEEFITNTSFGGSHYNVIIKMTKRPFKKLLMKVGTETSKALYAYLIEFEEACVEYMRYQYACTQETIRENRELIREAPVMNELDDKIDDGSVVEFENFDEFCTHVLELISDTTAVQDLQRIVGTRDAYTYTKIELVKMLIRKM